MIELAKTQPFYGLEFDGRSFDCGSKGGFLTANIAYALERSDIAPAIRAELRRLLGDGWCPGSEGRIMVPQPRLRTSESKDTSNFFIYCGFGLQNRLSDSLQSGL